MNGELDEIINYVNNNIRFGTKILQSLINDFVIRLRYSISEIYELYTEIRGLKLQIERDVVPEFGEYLFTQKNSWDEDIRELIKGLPTNFSISDLYLFSRDLSVAHPNNMNVKAKIRQVLQTLRDLNEIEFVEKGIYKKVFKKENDIQIDVDDDFQDLDELLSSDSFKAEMNDFHEVASFKNNIEYLDKYQNEKDDSALENLYVANQKLVMKIANGYKTFATTSFDRDDMVIEYKKIRKIYGGNFISLDLPTGSEEGTSTLGDLLPIEAERDEFEIIADKEISQKIESVLSELSERDSEIIRLRFGLENGEEHTLEQVGQIFGVTRERIRQIEAKTLKKLKNHNDIKEFKEKNSR